jgi:hypothetical protein
VLSDWIRELLFGLIRPKVPPRSLQLLKYQLATRHSPARSLGLTIVDDKTGPAWSSPIGTSIWTGAQACQNGRAWRRKGHRETD